MKYFIIILLNILTIQSTWGVRTPLDKDLISLSEIKTIQTTYAANIKRCTKLINELEFDPLYKTALKHILNHRMPSSASLNKFNKLSRDKTSMNKKQLLHNLNEQSAQLSKLIKHAWSDDLQKFNHVSRIMIEKFDLITPHFVIEHEAPEDSLSEAIQ